MDILRGSVQECDLRPRHRSDRIDRQLTYISTIKQVYSEWIVLGATALKGQSHEKVFEFLTWDGTVVLV
jgi:hypothetical protein